MRFDDSLRLRDFIALAPTLRRQTNEYISKKYKNLICEVNGKKND